MVLFVFIEYIRSSVLNELKSKIIYLVSAQNTNVIDIPLGSGANMTCSKHRISISFSSINYDATPNNLCMNSISLWTASPLVEVVLFSACASPPLRR